MPDQDYLKHNLLKPYDLVFRLTTRIWSKNETLSCFILISIIPFIQFLMKLLMIVNTLKICKSRFLIFCVIDMIRFSIYDLIILFMLLLSFILLFSRKAKIQPEIVF